MTCVLTDACVDTKYGSHAAGRLADRSYEGGRQTNPLDTDHPAVTAMAPRATGD